MNQKDNYDTIVENLTKEWEISMSSKSTDKWEIPKYSKSEINKASITISKSDISQEEKSNALEILNNWCSSHACQIISQIYLGL